ncbi:unnamed protein product [Lepidochelys olivacea]
MGGGISCSRQAKVFLRGDLPNLGVSGDSPCSLCRTVGCKKTILKDSGKKREQRSSIFSFVIPFVPISVETSEYMAAVENEEHSLVQLLLMYQALKKLDILHVMRGDELADYHSPKSTGCGDWPDSHLLKT